MFRWGNRSSRLAGWKTHPTILPRSGFELTTCRTPHLQTWSKCPTPLTTRPLGSYVTVPVSMIIEALLCPFHDNWSVNFHDHWRVNLPVSWSLKSWRYQCTRFRNNWSVNVPVSIIIEASTYQFAWCNHWTSLSVDVVIVELLCLLT